MTTRKIYDLLDRLAAAEDSFLRSDFLAPVVRGGVVQVRVEGVVCRLRVAGGFEGFGVFRPTSAGRAKLLRPATLAERQRYLALLPARRLILVQRDGRRWLTRPADAAEVLPLWLVEEAERFDTVLARFDGVRCWFERVDERSDPAAAAYLREAMGAPLAPEQLDRPGLTGGQRAAYALAHELLLEATRDRTEDRLRVALAHAGAEFRGYLERGDGFRVEYQVDGQRHVSHVGKDDLTVQTAGICLNGEDRRFDLASLVGVLREEDAGFVPRIGADNDGMAEADYWRVHPPRS